MKIEMIRRQRIYIPIFLLALAVAALFAFRSVEPTSYPSPEDVVLAKIAVYNQLMETKEGEKDAEGYAYFFVPAADKALIPRLVSKVAILDSSQSELKGDTIVSKVDGKPGKTFDVKVVSATPTSIVLFAKWIGR